MDNSILANASSVDLEETKRDRQNPCVIDFTDINCEIEENNKEVEIDSTETNEIEESKKSKKRRLRVRSNIRTLLRYAEFELYSVPTSLCRDF